MGADELKFEIAVRTCQSNCGICATVCPAGAIRKEAPWVDLRLGSILEPEEALLGRLEPARMSRV